MARDPRFYLPAAAAALLAAGAAAAAEPLADIRTLGIESLLDLDVGAVALHEQRASEAAASVFVLSADDLRLHGHRTLQEALRSVPGLFAYRDDLFPSVGVRGVGLLTDYTTRLLVLVDGHPLNNSLGIGESYLGRDLPVPLEAVRRIEVIKGPTGSVYGPTAFLGVVNVVTVEPGADAVSLRVGAEGGERSVQGGEGALAASFAVAGIKVAGSATGFATRGPTYVFPELTGAGDRPAPPGGRVAGAAFADSRTGYLRLEAGSLALTGACGLSFAGTPSAPYSSLIGDHRNHAETRTCYAALGLRRQLTSGLSLLARASYDDFRYRDAFAYDPPPASFGMYRDLGRDRWGSAEVRFTWRGQDGTVLLVGGSAQRHQTLQLVSDDSRGEAIRIPRDFSEALAYLLVERPVGPLRLHGGLTFAWNELFGSQVTPKVAALWRPAPGDVVKLIYSRGFRPPTAAEAFYRDGTDFLDNPGLRPETVESLELAWERRIGGVAWGSVSAFGSRYRRLIRFVTVPLFPGATDPADFRQQARNEGSDWHGGGEVAARVRLGRWLQGYGGIAAQAIGSGGRTNFPSVTGNLSLSTRALWEPLALSTSASYASPSRRDPTTLEAIAGPARERIGARFLLGASMLLDVPGIRGLSVEVGAWNLLDASAPDPVAGDFSPITALPQVPRTLRVALRWQQGVAP